MCSNSCGKGLVIFAITLVLGIASAEVQKKSYNKHNISNIVVKHNLVFREKKSPKWTEEARINKIQGSVKLKITFDELGKCNKIEVLQGLSFGLTENSVKAAEQTTIEPYNFLDKNFPFTTIITYNFNLENNGRITS